jgi:predicted permease
MQKALLISILFATVLIPLIAARGGSVKSAVRRSAIATSVFCVLYWLGLVFVYPMLNTGRPTQQPIENQDPPQP